MISAACISCLLWAGCQQEAKEEQAKAVFFPEAPDKPRLQWLKSYESAEDLGQQGPSAFEKFVVGEAQDSERIVQPYGVAIHQGKIYVCDVGRRMVEVLDVRNGTFGVLTKDRRVRNPVNIFIEDDGTKYVADPTAGVIFVFGPDDTMQAILGNDLDIAPIDVEVYGPLCYVTDFGSNQVVVLYKDSGKLVTKLGSVGEKRGQFQLISDLALDAEARVYVTDKVKGQILQFARSGKFNRVIGRRGDNIDEFVRPKGIDIDRKDRIWVVDAATEVGKIYDNQGRLLLFFGLPGNMPGMMNLPANIIVDYDNVEYFSQYAVEGAQLEFIVIVTNQYGPNKVSVYGFGEFPR